MKDFRIRCSALKQIMTEPREKNTGELSVTTQTYLKQWVVEQKYGRVKEFSSKFTEKGIAVEDEAIALYSEVSGRDFLKKNETQLENEFCTGTPDIITDIVVDIKSSWDIFTFPLFGIDKPNAAYWWQLQGYMWLTDKKEAELAYCLVDTPQSLIWKQINREKWNAVGTLSPEEESILEALTEQNMTFGDIPKKNRVRTLRIERDQDAIDRIAPRVEACRAYIDSLMATL